MSFDYEEFKKWECLYRQGGGTIGEYLTRFKIDNGWIYKYEKNEARGTGKFDTTIALTFVPNETSPRPE